MDEMLPNMIQIDRMNVTIIHHEPEQQVNQSFIHSEAEKSLYELVSKYLNFK